MTRLIIRAWVYWLPWILCPAMFYAWHSWSGSWAFAGFVLGLPFVYGYVAPGIATNLLKKWRFKGPWLLGAFYWHHGFMYAANMSPLLLLATLGLEPDSCAPLDIARVVFAAAALHGLILWWHDFLLVRHGMVVINNRPTKEGRSPGEIVSHYAPLCFSLIGLCYALACVAAYHELVIEAKSDLQTWTLLTAVSAGLLLGLPSLAYRLLED